MLSPLEIFVGVLILFILFRRPILFFLSRLLAKQIRKAAEKQSKQRGEPHHRDGETYISRNPNKSATDTTSEGEYVDFEEIK